MSVASITRAGPPATGEVTPVDAPPSTAQVPQAQATDALAPAQSDAEASSAPSAQVALRVPRAASVSQGTSASGGAQPVPTPRALSLREVEVGEVRLRTITLKELAKLPLSSTLHPIKPPFTEELLSFGARTNQAPADAKRLREEMHRQLEARPSPILEVLRGVIGFLTLPYDVALNIAKVFARIGGGHVDLDALRIPTSWCAPETFERPYNLRRLTPAQAVEVTQLIVTRALEYNYPQTERDANGVRTPRAVEISRHVDALPVDALLREGLGVCRNYAEAARVVFNTLKAIQDPAHDLLKNAYVRTVTSRGTPSHMWNALTLVEADGSVSIAQFDPTDYDVVHRDVAFGQVSLDTPEGLRTAYLHDRLLVGRENRWLAELGMRALGVTTYAEAKAGLKGELDARALAALSDELERLPSAVRISVFGRLSKLMSTSAWNDLVRLRTRQHRSVMRELNARVTM